MADWRERNKRKHGNSRCECLLPAKTLATGDENKVPTAGSKERK